jgi:hypothetical protein
MATTAKFDTECLVCGLELAPGQSAYVSMLASFEDVPVRSYFFCCPPCYGEYVTDMEERYPAIR